jgi:hypothetical protein
MKVDGLDRPDGVLDQAQGFVAFDGFAVVERGFRSGWRARRTM